MFQNLEVPGRVADSHDRSGLAEVVSFATAGTTGGCSRAGEDAQAGHGALAQGQHLLGIPVVLKESRLSLLQLIIRLFFF